MVIAMEISVIIFFIKFSAFIYLSSAEPLRQINTVSKSSSSGNQSARNIFFPYFTIVKFPNTACTTPNGSGICVPLNECRRNNGEPLGSCHKGLGTCCSLTRTCKEYGSDVVIKENGAIISTRANDPSSSCRFIFPKSKNICQLRLDFSSFSLQSPSSTDEGNCFDDYIELSNSPTLTVPMKICGQATGQRVYLDYGTSQTDKIVIASKVSSSTGAYSIKTTQIPCGSEDLAPKNCLQYYEGISEQVKSFNFDGNAQLNDHYYTICVKRSGSLSRIRWTECSPGSFLLSGENGDSPVEPGLACSSKDYVQIFGDNQQCGNSFNPVESDAKPYALRVNFNSMESPVVLPDFPVVGVDELECEKQGNENPVLNCRFEPQLQVCYCNIDSGPVDKKNWGFCLTYVQTN